MWDRYLHPPLRGLEVRSYLSCLPPKLCLIHRVLTPPPPPLCASKAGSKSFEQVKIPPTSSPLGWARYLAKPFQFMSSSALAPTRSPPISESAVLCQWPLYINHYTEAPSLAVISTVFTYHINTMFDSLL